MVKQTDIPETVRLSHSINDEEIKYVTLRKTLIKKWLKDQGINCELEDVPNIALLGSGGGERAAVGMLGSLFQLVQDNLLGSLLYMCGVSGTTWCMSSLYSDSDWSLNMRCDEVIEKLKGPTVGLSKAVKWLKLRKEQNQDFNLTEFWGAFTASYFMKEMHTRCLSEEAHRNSTNPYPIYSAIELEHNKLDCTKGVWFEMTPHESGFSGLGAFVPTSCLGSQFEGGTLREKRKEMDMVLLQGICGSAIADGQRNNAEVVKMIWALLGVTFSAGIKTKGQNSMMLMSARGGKVEVCESVPSQVVRCVSELMVNAEDPDPLKTWNVITTLRQLLEGHVSSKGEMLWNMDSESWKRTSLEERKKFIETVSLELILTSDSWTKDWEDKRYTYNASADESKYMVTTGMKDKVSIINSWVPDELWIVQNIFPLVKKWEWGTVYNFFFNIQDTNVLSSMASKDKIHLVDAGLKINSPYPPVLRPSRDVDLIISLDFSAGDPFETVLSAKQYADELKLPFPPVKESVRKEKEHPQDCYVFEGRRPEEPTIMHMPLFNLQNCKGEEEIKKEREKYTTFQQHYGVSDIEHLLEKAKDNMRNNRDRILEQILLAVKRRKNRKGPEP
ncbi:cytosolic phospholipase A2 gamma [Salmo salar]|uniref:Cytosolic phospholipase A2 gamma n=1 Tax=Salmo salar TaxID=8030 RepID=A0A1S3N8F2_SALSA|nr:cytosolic phospholipase A2 gamma [Salmo salar]|eukprot:XP_014011709.1 PREDICTED: cytosolic phospholipase A2 gamma-like isoform X1 [Salmo salar]